MRGHLLIIFSSLFVSYAYSQNISIQNVSVPVEYVQLPATPLPPAYKTYSTKLDIPYSISSRLPLSTSGLESEYLKLEGYEKAASRGDVVITGLVGDFTNWGEYQRTRTSKVKNKDGTTTTKRSYYLELRYSMAVGVRVENGEGRRIMEEDMISGGDVKSWESPTYTTTGGLESYWRSAEQRETTEIQERLIKEGLKKAQKRINYLFGFEVMTETVKFETIGKKKHEHYPSFNENAEIIKKIFSEVKAQTPMKGIRPKFDPVIKFYQSEGDKISGRSKDEDKLRHICWYNIGLIYFWTEELDKSETYADKILRFDPEDKDARRLKEDIQELRSVFENSGRSTRHGGR